MSHNEQFKCNLAFIAVLFFSLHAVPVGDSLSPPPLSKKAYLDETLYLNFFKLTFKSIFSKDATEYEIQF